VTGDLLCVLPCISHHTADICLPSIVREDSAAGLDPSEVLIVDNSPAGSFTGWQRFGFRYHRDADGHNLGVARSWNVGARAVLERGLDYLVIMSTAMQFGPILHTTWRRQMETFWGAHVIEADGHSWHLIAFHRRVFETVGLFDPAFWPAYEEGIDFGYRMRLCGLEGGWTRVWVNALSQGHAMHVDIVDCPFVPLRNFYISKWGGAKGEEKWTKPFGDKPIDYITEEPIPVLAERYGVTRWW
jgi:hypothetical protein